MITYLGNKDLLNMSKTAFLASNTIPIDMVLRCYDWAQKNSIGKDCIISGFSSHLEERVLHFLKKGTCPIIIVLARKMYKRVPEELLPLLERGRLLILSVSATSRQSRSTAFIRNKFICEQADRIVMVGVSSTSSLFPLSNEFKSKLVSLQTT